MENVRLWYFQFYFNEIIESETPQKVIHVNQTLKKWDIKRIKDVKIRYRENNDEIKKGLSQ